MQYKREISSKLIRLASDFPALVLTGARQVGKTTILRELFPQHTYISLDIPSTAQLASENPELFLQRYPPPLIVDEVQYAPAVFRNLKTWIDSHRSMKGQIILTGSQKFGLMKEVSESLAGRIAVAELEPLSLFEIAQERRISTKNLPTLISRGAFPELWKEPDRDSFRTTNPI